MTWWLPDKRNHQVFRISVDDGTVSWGPNPDSQKYILSFTLKLL